MCYVTFIKLIKEHQSIDFCHQVSAVAFINAYPLITANYTYKGRQLLKRMYVITYFVGRNVFQDELNCHIIINQNVINNISKHFSSFQLAWIIHKEHKNLFTLEDGTIDLGSMRWDNALNQTSSFIPFYQNSKVNKQIPILKIS